MRGILYKRRQPVVEISLGQLVPLSDGEDNPWLIHPCSLLGPCSSYAVTPRNCGGFQSPRNNQRIVVRDWDMNDRIEGGEHLFTVADGVLKDKFVMNLKKELDLKITNELFLFLRSSNSK